MTWPDRLRDWSRLLAAAGVPSPDADARWLAAHVLGCRPAEVLFAPAPTEDQVARVTALVERRVRREPLQHILGTAPFLDLELAVGPGVFVPRPETEVMADHVIRWLSTESDRHRDGGPVVVDLCTGSAALALAIACHVPGARVVAVDTSTDALAYARRNAEGLADRITAAGSRLAVVQADVTATPELGVSAADAVVANPPYVPDRAVPRDPEVRDYDPPPALFAGADGYDVIRPLLGLAAGLLRRGGLLAVEHGDEQGGADGVPGLVLHCGAFTDVTDRTDLAGRPRFTTAVRR